MTKVGFTGFWHFAGERGASARCLPSPLLIGDVQIFRYIPVHGLFTMAFMIGKRQMDPVLTILSCQMTSDRLTN